VNYFTSERLVRLQDRADEHSFLTALNDWENALKAYNDQFERIRGQLPGDMRKLIEAVSLHDARVLDMWWGGRTQFTVTLHPESDPLRLVVLNYSLVEPPTVEGNVLPSWDGPNQSRGSTMNCSSAKRLDRETRRSRITFS